MGKNILTRRFLNPGIVKQRGVGKGLTRAKIFLVELTFNIHSVQITNPTGAKPSQKLAHDLSKMLHAFLKLQISAFIQINQLLANHHQDGPAYFN